MSVYSRLGAKAQPSSEQTCGVISNHLHCMDSMSPLYARFPWAPVIALYSHHRVHWARTIITRSLAKAVWLRETKILDRGQTRDVRGSRLLCAPKYWSRPMPAPPYPGTFNVSQTATTLSYSNIWLVSGAFVFCLSPYRLERLLERGEPRSWWGR